MDLLEHLLDIYILVGVEVEQVVLELLHLLLLILRQAVQQLRVLLELLEDQLEFYLHLILV
jgi:hypothetical protein